ncbi:hypothetical protein Nepgr_012444 [Nepenthes gracilis]|uniref:Uncharacterized protein n=1 Tax=Nepenthes gracilis TaxID=150966 RepID=A0AAD3XN36_NEPGR|nr:hypothetical protein Nepgr_012444 [Nepenthes gracilis]
MVDLQLLRNLKLLGDPRVDLIAGVVMSANGSIAVPALLQVAAGLPSRIGCCSGWAGGFAAWVYHAIGLSQGRLNWILLKANSDSCCVAAMSAPSVAKAGSNKVKFGIAPSVIAPALADFAQTTTKSWSHVAQIGDLNTLLCLLLGFPLFPVLVEVNRESPISGEPFDGDPGNTVGVEGSSFDCAEDAMALKLEVDSGGATLCSLEDSVGAHQALVTPSRDQNRLGKGSERVYYSGDCWVDDIDVSTPDSIMRLYRKYSLVDSVHSVSSIGYTSGALGGSKLSEPLEDNQIALNPDHLASCRAVDALANAAAFFHSHHDEVVAGMLSPPGCLLPGRRIAADGVQMFPCVEGAGAVLLKIWLKFSFGCPAILGFSQLPMWTCILDCVVSWLRHDVLDACGC